MPDIVSGKIWVDGEKGVSASKMNQQFSGAVIQPDFYTAKPTSSTLDSTDQLLELKGTGSYARITGQQLIDSVSASVTQNIQPTIWSVRLRSFNAVGNPNFEVDQRSAGTTVAAANGFVQDRWQTGKAGTMVVSAGQQVASGAELVVPGTNFAISRNFHRITLTTAQASLGATDYLYLLSIIEGSQFRELQYDVHSISVLVRSSVAGLKFGMSLRDPSTTRSITKLCTIPSSATWTLIPLANLPVFPPAGTFSSAPGVGGYTIALCLAAGTTFTAPANDTWQNGNFLGAVGQDNFASKATSSTFDVAFVQHEPGNQCTTLIDCPFGENLDGRMGCVRYYCKSYNYGDKPGLVTSAGPPTFYIQANGHAFTPIVYPKRMAKLPTLTGYSPTSGAINNVRDYSSSVDRATSGTQQPGETGFSGFVLATTNAGTASYGFHWTADTGW